MHECELLLDPNTAAGDEHRWTADVGEQVCELFIPTWRVPRPVPDTIQLGVDIAAATVRLESLSKSELTAHPGLTARPIAVILKAGDPPGECLPPDGVEHSEVTRARLPVTWLPEDAESRVQLTVKWGLGTSGGFE